MKIRTFIGSIIAFNITRESSRRSNHSKVRHQPSVTADKSSSSMRLESHKSEQDTEYQQQSSAMVLNGHDDVGLVEVLKSKYSKVKELCEVPFVNTMAASNHRSSG